MSFLTILVERKEYAIWFARPRSTKGGYRTKENCVREFLHSKNEQANMKKLLIALTFFTWMRSTRQARDLMIVLMSASRFSLLFALLLAGDFLRANFGY
jgi:hypothetical protein